MALRIISLRHTAPEFEDCFAIRKEVFVDEQHVPLEEERDTLDPVALHFLAFDDERPIGTARAIVKDQGKTIKIGRVAIRREARGRQIGAALMKAVETAPEFAGAAGFVLDGQIQALPFYQKLGYTAEGDVFFDGGIPHLLMRKLRA